MSVRDAWARFVRAVGVPRPHKYRARAVQIDGIRFASMREGARYRDLRLLVAAGMIRDLECHPAFPILVPDLATGGRAVAAGHYTADFRYVECQTGDTVIEDVKSAPTKTTAYKLRKRLIETTYGITIREV